MSMGFVYEDTLDPVLRDDTVNGHEGVSVVVFDAHDDDEEMADTISFEDPQRLLGWVESLNKVVAEKYPAWGRRRRFRALMDQVEDWCDKYDEGQTVEDAQGRKMMLSFGEDGYRVLVFVVDMPDPPSKLDEWREITSLSLDAGGSYGHWLAEVIAL